MPKLSFLNNKFPEWSELEKVEHLHLDSEIKRKINSKAALFVIKGKVILRNTSEYILNENDFKFLSNEDILLKSSSDTSEVFLIYGNWENEIGNCGVFTMNNSDTPRNIGDPVDYQRTTNFDNHFHDCDEYWFILKGSGTAYSEEIKYEFNAGDCIATRSGIHHDIVDIKEEVLGIYFETTLKGLKRTGHLWEHTHSK